MEHPITPPDELVEQWWHDATGTTYQMIEYIATQAARWGDDQRLEEIIHWLITGPYGASIAAAPGDLIHQLRAAMRPKPPSLKQQAIADLRTLAADLKAHGLGCNTDTIERALEALSDD